LTPDTLFSAYPRWQTTAWVYLGANLVEVSNVHTGGLGFASLQPVRISSIPDLVHLVPVVVVASAAFYTCYKMDSARRIKHNISNALAAGTGYFLIGLVMMVFSNIQPSISSMLSLALIAGAGLWLGSSFVGAFTRGLPFFGVASLGSIAAIGILLLLGGVAVLSVIWGLVAISFGSAAVVGSAVGMSRRLERRGRGHDVRFARVRGLRSLLESYWLEIVVTSAVVVALVVGINGGL
jgi:hypothetical protein